MNDRSKTLVTADLCEMTGRRYAGLAGRASAAIWAGLRAREIKGRWILIPANMCYVVAWTILQSGNLPYLVDVDPSTGNISPDTLSHVQVESPAALVICHMYGLGAPIAQLAEWANRREIFVIEDATLALGATVDDRPAGSWGDLSLFSFGEGKILDVGNGGAFLCDDPELVNQVQVELEQLPPWSKPLERLRDQWTELYWLLHQYEKPNPPLTTIYPQLFQLYGNLTRYQFDFSRAESLATGLANLRANLAHRTEIASFYDERLANLPIHTLLRPPGHVLWRYPLLVPVQHRDGLLELLWENGILASRWYPSLEPMLSALAPNIEKKELPGAEQLATEIINLPVDQTVDMELSETITEIIKDYFQEKRKFRTRFLN